MLLGCMCYWIVCSGELCVLLGICVGGFLLCWAMCWIVCVDGFYVLLGSVCCKVVSCVCCWVVCWIVCVDGLCVGLCVLMGCMYCWVLYVERLLSCVRCLVVCIDWLCMLFVCTRCWVICNVGFYMLLSCMYCGIVYGMCAVFCRSGVYVVRLYIRFLGL